MTVRFPSGRMDTSRKASNTSELEWLLRPVDATWTHGRNGTYRKTRSPWTEKHAPPTRARATRRAGTLERNHE